MASHVNISQIFSKSHAHAFSCQPKHCWSQINEVLILSHNVLKLVSAIFDQIFVFLPNNSPSKTMKNIFYFI